MVFLSKASGEHGGGHPMTETQGWTPEPMLPVAWFINSLTRRMDFVCELTTSVYVSVASVSRVFCCPAIAPKTFTFKSFGVINGLECL
jgi:hypothetical protein